MELLQQLLLREVEKAIGMVIVALACRSMTADCIVDVLRKHKAYDALLGVFSEIEPSELRGLLSDGLTTLREAPTNSSENIERLERLMEALGIEAL